MTIVVPRKKLVLTILSSITAGSSWKETGRLSALAIDISKTVGFQRRSESLLMPARTACAIVQLPLHLCVPSRCATCVPVGESPPVTLILDDFFGRLLPFVKGSLD